MERRNESTLTTWLPPSQSFLIKISGGERRWLYMFVPRISHSYHMQVFMLLLCREQGVFPELDDCNGFNPSLMLEQSSYPLLSFPGYLCSRSSIPWLAPKASECPDAYNVVGGWWLVAGGWQRLHFTNFIISVLVMVMLIIQYE